MRQVRRAAAVAAGLLSLTVATAKAQGTFGMAGVQCSQYTKAARSSDILFHQASQWLLGYISGMNAAMKTASGTTLVGTLTGDQVLKSAGHYCASNPDSTLANAANEGYASLQKQTDPKQAEAKPAPSSSGTLILNLDTAPGRKPLLDRH